MHRHRYQQRQRQQQKISEAAPAKSVAGFDDRDNGGSSTSPGMHLEEGTSQRVEGTRWTGRRCAETHGRTDTRRDWAAFECPRTPLRFRQLTCERTGLRRTGACSLRGQCGG
ncbi:unnamed protein product [Lampetra fluviatilis]